MNRIHFRKTPSGRGKRNVRPTIITAGEVADIIGNEIKKCLEAAYVPSETTHNLPERLGETVQVTPYSDRRASINFNFTSNSREMYNPDKGGNMSDWFLEGTESHLILPTKAKVLAFQPDERWPPYRRINRNTVKRLPQGSWVFSKGHWVSGLTKPDGDPVNQGIDLGLQRVRSIISKKTSSAKYRSKRRIREIDQQIGLAVKGKYTKKPLEKLVEDLEKHEKLYSKHDRAQRARQRGEFPLERGTMTHADIITKNIPKEVQ